MARGMLTLILLTSAAIAVAEELSQGSAVSVYTPPTPIARVNPKFPMAQANKGREGWVKLNYMVDPEGVPYDIFVSESSEDPAFEKAARRAIERWRYTPAAFEGQPIDSGITQTIIFQLAGGQTGATSKFVSQYRRFQRALDAEDREKAQKMLDGMMERRANLYEEAYMQVARYGFARRWGTKAEQYDALTKASKMDGDRGFLPDGSLLAMSRLTLQLQLELNLLVKAAETIKQLRKISDEAPLHQYWDDVETQISQVREEGRSFTNAHRIPLASTLVYDLMHPSFALSVDEGRISELRLHCNRGRVGFAFDPELSYQVKEGWSDCNLIVIGDPDTRFVIRDGA